MQPVRRRHRERHRGRARPQGPGEADRVLQRRGRGRGPRRRGMSEPAASSARFGPYGGRYVPETLMPALDELERGVARPPAPTRPSRRELDELLRDYVGPPDAALPRAAPLGARRAARSASSARTSRTPARTRSTTRSGQALLAQRMGKPRVIAETGAGQHGVATATACALLGLECVVYMGTEDMRRQEPERAAHAPAGRRGAARGRGRRARSRRRCRRRSATGWRTWTTTHYVIGSCVGPGARTRRSCATSSA